MPLFDAYIMTDWSGDSRRRKNRRDAIWIAYGGIEDDSPQTESPPSRSEAVELIRSLMLEQPGSGWPILVLSSRSCLPAYSSASTGPFETGWAGEASWLRNHISIVHAEFYPSVREPKPDPIKDRGQVHAMWEWARDLDRQDQLWYEFARPVDIDPGSKEDIAVQLTEG